jgi:hypothetical protein
LVIFLFTELAAGQQIDFKDLTQEFPNPLKHEKFQPDNSCGNGGGGGGAYSIGCPPATYPFELSLVNVDSNTIPVGGEFMALLRLRNIGHDPASVPWTIDSNQIELPDENGKYQFSQVDIRADLTQAGGASHIWIPVYLYGSVNANGSLQQIKPGDWVELRVRLVLDCKNESSDCKLLKQGRAKLSFTWTESANTEFYNKCGMESSSSREGELNSNATDVEVSQTTESK